MTRKPGADWGVRGSSCLRSPLLFVALLALACLL